MLIQQTPVRIVEDLWMLATAAYPLYLVRAGQSAAVFEGGTGAMGPLVKEQLAELETGLPAVRQIVVTHAHPDHVMAVPLLRGLFPEAKVLASQAAADTLSSEKAVAFFAKMDGALTEALVQQGLVGAEHRPPPLAESTIPVDRVIGEGDCIEVDGGWTFQVLQTPGHSDCSLSFFEPRRKVLFVSDATGYYMPEHDCWWPNYFTDYDAYVRSIERLAGLGAEVLCLSHNAVVVGRDAVAQYFQRVLEATREYHERIVAEARAGRPARQIAETLGKDIYEKKPLFPLEFFQKNCALLVKLSLRHEGIEVDK